MNYLNRYLDWIGTTMNFLNYSVKQVTKKKFYMNVRNLNKSINKIDELFGLLPCSPEVMVISETKFKNINYNFISIENYHFYLTNSPTNSEAVGIYLKASLNYKICLDLCLNEDLIEDIWVEIKPNNVLKHMSWVGFTSILIH